MLLRLHLMSISSTPSAHWIRWIRWLRFFIPPRFALFWRYFLHLWISNFISIPSPHSSFWLLLCSIYAIRSQTDSRNPICSRLSYCVLLTHMRVICNNNYILSTSISGFVCSFILMIDQTNMIVSLANEDIFYSFVPCSLRYCSFVFAKTHSKGLAQCLALNGNLRLIYILILRTICTLA